MALDGFAACTGQLGACAEVTTITNDEIRKMRLLSLEGKTTDVVLFLCRVSRADILTRMSKVSSDEETQEFLSILAWAQFKSTMESRCEQTGGGGNFTPPWSIRIEALENVGR